jgi:hypothetical protein
MLCVTRLGPGVRKIYVVGADTAGGQEKIHQRPRIRPGDTQVAKLGACCTVSKELYKREGKLDREKISLGNSGGSGKEEVAAAGPDFDFQRRLTSEQ